MNNIHIMSTNSYYKKKFQQQSAPRPNESYEAYIKRRVGQGIARWKLKDELKTHYPDQFDESSYSKTITIAKEELKDFIEIYNSDSKNFIVGAYLTELSSDDVDINSRLKILDQLSKLSGLYIEKSETKLDASNFGFEFNID